LLKIAQFKQTEDNVMRERIVMGVEDNLMQKGLLNRDRPVLAYKPLECHVLISPALRKEKGRSTITENSPYDLK